MSREKEKDEANLGVIRIDARHCFKCGCVMTTGKHRKTKHHSIPYFLKPLRNVEIPVCSNCHIEINRYLVQAIPNFKSLRNFIKGLEDIINKYKPILERYDNDEQVPSSERSD